MALARRVQKVFVAATEFPKNRWEVFQKYKSVEFIDASGDFGKLKDAEVILGDPFALQENIYKLPNLKWYQSTWAGVDGLMQWVDPGKLPSFTLTRCGELYGPIIMQYVVGNIISYERNFRQMWTDQKEHKWDEEMWKSFSHRLMHELTVGVIGLGNIGSHIAQACKALGMTVWGLGRKELDKPPPCVDHYRSTGGLTELLQSCDYVCNVLPSTPSSRHLLSGTVLENCKERKAVFINVGRGDVIDEGSLVQALEKGWLSGAIVDVFEKEPLPKDSPLWDMPGVVITPHNSGIAPADVILPLFMENLALYEAGKPMKYEVDWNQGY